MNNCWIQDRILSKSIFLYGNVPSSKNSKEIQKFKKYKRIAGTDVRYKDANGQEVLQEFFRLGNSKTVEEYIKNFAYQYMEKKVDIYNLFGTKYPIKLGLYFVRDSHRRFDYINAAQILCDLMVKYNIFPDDNADNIIPIFLGYHVDKNKPGVYLIDCNHTYYIDEVISYFNAKLDHIKDDLSPDIDKCHFAINELNKLKNNIL